MANKVLQIGTIDEPQANDTFVYEVYRDVSMNSKSLVLNSDTNYKITKNVNAIAVKKALHNCFTWIPGERILLPEFGSRLYTLLYEGITPETEERIAAEIRHCVSEWEPRAQIVEIRNVGGVEETENNTIHLEVIFVIPSLNDEQYSYSFYYNPIAAD